MYVQPPHKNVNTDIEGIVLPRDYSGNAFREEIAPPPPSPLKEEGPTAPAESPAAKQDAASEETALPASLPREAASSPSPTPPREHPLTGRFSFLSSLLPPPRGGGKDGGRGLSDWAIPGLILWMLLEGRDNDALPFLVALLLWD